MPLFPVGCGEVVVVLPEEVGGVLLLLWQAVSVRPARATAANLRVWLIQYAIAFDCRNVLKELVLYAKYRAAFG